MPTRTRWRLLESALLATLGAGCCMPLFEARSEGGWSFHVVAAPPHFGAPPVDGRGFFGADVCRSACKNATVCYPTTVRSPAFPRVPRKVGCAMELDQPEAGYATEFGHRIELTPEQEASTTIGPQGEIARRVCATLCENNALRRRQNLRPAHSTSCEAEPLPPPVVSAEEIFVVCGLYRPPRCVDRKVYGS